MTTLVSVLLGWAGVVAGLGLGGAIITIGSHVSNILDAQFNRDIFERKVLK